MDEPPAVHSILVGHPYKQAEEGKIDDSNQGELIACWRHGALFCLVDWTVVFFGILFLYILYLALTR